jgi:hypothetical protein
MKPQTTEEKRVGSLDSFEKVRNSADKIIEESA